ncbi:MAG: hypothetical protein DRP62_05025 [Planctomycetota bacterium]|nr:MAG: hypothetical protein DRP62_05025 [Planctomycetota bacterium]
MLVEEEKRVSSIEDMNRQQKSLLINFIAVTVITAVVIVAMVNLRNWVNRSEARRAMEHLGKVVLQYRSEHGSVPPESYVNNIRENLEGNVRLGKLHYRARWLDFDSTKDEILAYTEHAHRSWLFGDKFIVLRLDGRVEWMERQQLQDILARQQSPMEIQTLQKE